MQRPFARGNFAAYRRLECVRFDSWLSYSCLVLVFVLHIYFRASRLFFSPLVQNSAHTDNSENCVRIGQQKLEDFYGAQKEKWPLTQKRRSIGSKPTSLPRPPKQANAEQEITEITETFFSVPSGENNYFAARIALHGIANHSLDRVDIETD